MAVNLTEVKYLIISSLQAPLQPIEKSGAEEMVSYAH